MSYSTVGYLQSPKPAATTTLQALVNLKRPSIRLTPLTATTDDPSPSEHLATITAAHGLEFDFDCDAARCNITLNALLPGPSHNSPSPSDPSSSQSTSVLLFNHVVDGGFGKTLRLEDGAILELNKIDAELHPKHTHSNSSQAALDISHGSPTPGSQTALDQSHSRLGAPDKLGNKKRLSSFAFRRKHDREAAGPALQVVDADVEAAALAARRASAEDHENDDAPQQDTGEGPSKTHESEANDGIRVTIKLEALDEKGRFAMCRFYTHIS